MKFYAKVFIVSFIAFLSLFGGVFFALESFYNSSESPNGNSEETSDEIVGSVIEKRPISAIDPENDDRTELRKIADASTRVNVIAFGLNDMLADTMMLISFDPTIPQIDVLSIPRDTYHHVEGFDYPGAKKMNAVYGFREVGGVNGMKNFLSDFLDVPIDYYVKVDFDAVETIVDVLGGYEVTIEYDDMNYDDPYATPPLHIHFEPGYQVLDGADSVRYLRFRKNNSGTIQEGDVQRIPRQQHFVNTMMQKAIGPKLPAVINTIITSKFVKTDMTLEHALAYALKAAEIDTTKINFYMIEGVPQRINGLDYWIHDPALLNETLFKIYGLVTENEENTESEESGSEESESETP